MIEPIVDHADDPTEVVRTMVRVQSLFSPMPRWRMSACWLESRAALAAPPGPGVGTLERDLVAVAVAHPDLEDALDVHLHHNLLLQAALGLEEPGKMASSNPLLSRPMLNTMGFGDLAGPSGGAITTGTATTGSSCRRGRAWRSPPLEAPVQGEGAGRGVAAAGLRRDLVLVLPPGWLPRRAPATPTSGRVSAAPM